MRQAVVSLLAGAGPAARVRLGCVSSSLHGPAMCAVQLVCNPTSSTPLWTSTLCLYGSAS